MTLLRDGKNLALVTDAGTPGISDPGNELISVILSKAKNRGRDHLDPSPVATLEVQDKNARIVPIPGASAAIAALSISGFPTDKFLFLGFPPHKNKRQKFFKQVSECEYAVVFYESGHRIIKCLGELKESLASDRQIVVGREITKKFETINRGTAAELVGKLTDERGEFVVVVNAQ